MKQKSITIISILILISGLYNTFFIPGAIILQTIKQGRITSITDKIIVEKVIPSSPASLASIQTKDIIASVNGIPVTNIEDFRNTMSENKGKSVNIGLIRNGESVSAVLVPRISYPPNEGPSGLVITDLESKTGNPVQLIPQALFNFYNESQLYATITRRNNFTLTPFHVLIIGISEIIIAVGIMRRKKLALYFFLALMIFMTLYRIYFLFTGGKVIYLQLVLMIIIELSLALYLFSKRKIFW